MGPAPAPEVFISYSSQDRAAVLKIADRLEAAGVRLWLDRRKIEGGAQWDVEIVRAIAACKVVMLICSAASVRSKNVKQEILLAWDYDRPYLPLLLDAAVETAFPEQIRYFLTGRQWIEVKDRPADQWLPAAAHSLALLGIECDDVEPAADPHTLRVAEHCLVTR